MRLQPHHVDTHSVENKLVAARAARSNAATSTMRAALASLCVVLTASLNMEEMDSMNVCGVAEQQKGGAWSFKDCDGFTLFQIYLGPDGAEAVAAGLAENQRNHGNDIKLFQVAKAGTGNAGGTALARALKDHAELRTIDLRGNELGDETMLALAETLGSTTSKRLEVLRLDNNAIGDVGMKALAEPLKKATQLESLILGKNQIGDAGVAALAGALEGAGGLAPGVMRLNDNQFGDEGILALAAAFKTNEKKIRLHVANNTIGDEAMATITAVLRGRAPPKSDRGPMTPEQIAAMNARFKELGLDYEYGGKQHQQENKEENKEEL